MSSEVLINAKVIVAGFDFSGQANALGLKYSAEMRDATTFGQTTRINAGGLKGIVADHSGLWDSSTTSAPDPAIFDLIGVADVPVSIGPTGVVADVSYMFRSIHSEYSPAGKIGDLFSFDVKMDGAGGQPLVRGRFLHNGSATGNVTGTAVQLGAVSATQFLYGALHVFSGTGSFIVKIQSSVDQAFTTPVDRITFATIATGTPVASEWAVRVPGAITHTWWRATATNPNTRNFAVSAGIQ